MQPLSDVIHKTPEEIDHAIKEREAAAELLPPGTTKESVLVDVARLRSYAEMKRLLASPADAL
jgi:hypothetical protein